MKFIYECAKCGEKYDYEFIFCDNCGGVDYHKVKLETFEIWQASSLWKTWMKTGILTLFIVNVGKYSQNKVLAAIREVVKEVSYIDARPRASFKRNASNS